ncbi:MAG: Omp28 family outer membrane lipoprotein [Chlorobi bacterium]|nr:Omp28 family outer membrane lipoprotein [Chlorobiota bacterium]
MKYLKTILLLSGFLLFFACDQINNPLKEKQEGTCGDETQPVPIRKILVEDYTGHRCPNCPAASEILEEIKNDYCDHVIPLAVHVGFFALPTEPDFPEDFRTETGTTLDEVYGISAKGLPAGMINRTEFNGNTVLGKDTWRAAVDAVYDINPEVNIIIESSYNQEENSVSVNITAEFLGDIQEAVNLGLYVTEDSIVAPQQVENTYNPEYVHRYMLKKGINGAFGEKILNSAKKGDTFEKQFTFYPDTEWNLNRLTLIAFVSRNSTDEILQAESEPLNLSN